MQPSPPPLHLSQTAATATTVVVAAAVLLLAFHASAVPPEERTYIIRVDGDLKPSLFPTHRHWYAAALSVLPTAPTPIHTYSTLFHGFAVRLTQAHVETLVATHQGFLSAIPEQIRQLDTTRSPEFLGLEPTDTSGLLVESDFGSDLVIAVIDTGIFPYRRSFNDAGLGPVPAKWKGECEAGPGFDPGSACNKKLVGARSFSAGYEATAGKMNETAERRSPADTDGHGTHTASIAAGRRVWPASTLGYARGAAAGMAEKARLAAYKACWAAGCFDSDILAAFDAAVRDGADVVSLSVGGAVVPFYLDAIAVGAYAAACAGVFVAASAGNGGPGAGTVANVAPWVATVGAGSLDRVFPAAVRLGDGRAVEGVSVYGGPALAGGRMYSLAYAEAAGGGGDGYSAALCLEGSLDERSVRGKIVICDRGVNGRAAKGEVVRKAGGVGMVLANGVFDGEGLVADCHVLPAAAVGAMAGEVVRSYASSGSAAGPGLLPTATIEFLGTRLGVRPAPLLASFSARGPNPHAPEILKPDIIAPGLNILAAWPDNVGPSGIPGDARRTEFNILSGTSMACPHVSGLAALLKAAHPDWSPAAIRSALMTTAYTRGTGDMTMFDEATMNTSATALDFGAGHVDPRRAMDPGLVYDISSMDYVYFMCNLNYTNENIKTVTREKVVDCRNAKTLAGHAGNLNYPSMAATLLQELGRAKLSTHFIRTATNVGPTARVVYEAVVATPEGCEVVVEPRRLAFRRLGQKLSFAVRVVAREVRLPRGGSAVRSGSLTWEDRDGKHTVRSPIVVTLQNPI